MPESRETTDGNFRGEPKSEWGTHSKAIARPSDRERIQRFYRDVLGCSVSRGPEHPGGPKDTDRAEAIIAAYRSAVTDTAVLRVQGAALHTTLGEIALAEHHADRALAEFREGDTAYDGLPATECAPCLPIELARAFDAAGQADSAIAQYEQFIATPYYNRLVETDPLALALAQDRLGELYEARGDAARAAAHDQRFIALWANADPDLQPRVAQVRQRLAELGAREGKR